MPARRLCLFLFLMPWLLACPQQEARETAQAEDVLEVEDVTPPVDMELTTEADAKGPPVVQGVSGVLPSDYPRGLPTHEPSSVSDFGDGPNGARFVEFTSPTAASSVAASLKGRLQGSGWRLEEDGQGRFRTSKDGIVVNFEVTALYSGSRIQVDY